MTRSKNSSRAVLRVLALALLLVLLVPALGANAERKKKGDEEEKGSGLNKHVAEKLLEANELMDEEKYDAALELVDKAAKRRKLKAPDLAQIHRFRGYIYVNKNMLEQGAAELQLSLDQHGLDRSAEQVTTYSLAQLYTQLGQYDRALGLIDTWFQSAENPKPDAYYLKAMILVQQEKPDAALEPAKIAIESSPSPRESWVQLLAAIYIQLRDYPNVAATLERLVDMAPDKKQYWVQLAAVQHHLEKDARATATLRLAEDAGLLNEDKEFRQLARLLFLRDQPYQCAKTVEEAVAAGVIKPDADAYKLISNCYIAARENDRALEPLAKAAELSTDGDMYMLLGQMHLQRDRFGPALDALQKSLAKAKPEQRGSVNLLIGVAQLGAERLDDAERAFRAAQSDEKTRRAADSYLKYLEEQRARRDQPATVQTASRN
jgi:predicted negative regulator of RcsB-dependent stress response